MSCPSGWRATRSAIASQTLYLSPGHALFLNGVLIRVKDLVNGTTIAPIAPHDHIAIEYYAVLLATHQVILAEGAAAETFHPSASNRENFSNMLVTNARRCHLMQRFWARKAAGSI
ncbi:hypothetical protein QO004_004232 [Rhizobium mesoamericanum]|nr:hypothetical protein [Rhizobium mesoamericanum]